MASLLDLRNSGVRKRSPVHWRKPVILGNSTTNGNDNLEAFEVSSCLRRTVPEVRSFA
jgi:hypothetical protein